MHKQRHDLKKSLLELQQKMKDTIGDEKLAVVSEYDKMMQVWVIPGVMQVDELQVFISLSPFPRTCPNSDLS